MPRVALIQPSCIHIKEQESELLNLLIALTTLSKSSELIRKQKEIFSVGILGLVDSHKVNVPNLGKYGVPGR